MRTSSNGDEEFVRKLQDAGSGGGAVIADDEDEYNSGRRSSLNDKDDILEYGEPPSTMSQEQARLISIQRIAFLIKMICTLDFLFSVYSYTVREAWWLMGSLGFLINPLVFYGAHTYRRRLILVYCAYLVVDTIFQFVYLFVAKEDGNLVKAITILLCIFFVVVKGYIVFYVFSFYRLLPSQGGWGPSIVLNNDVPLHHELPSSHSERATSEEDDA